MYTGEMNLDQRSVQDILVAADMIQLKEVKYSVHTVRTVHCTLLHGEWCWAGGSGGILRQNRASIKDNIYIDMQAGRNLLPKLLVADN